MEDVPTRSASIATPGDRVFAVDYSAEPIADAVLNRTANERTKAVGEINECMHEVKRAVEHKQYNKDGSKCSTCSGVITCSGDIITGVGA